MSNENLLNPLSQKQSYIAGIYYSFFTVFNVYEFLYWYRGLSASKYIPVVDCIQITGISIFLHLFSCVPLLFHISIMNKELVKPYLLCTVLSMFNIANNLPSFNNNKDYVGVTFENRLPSIVWAGFFIFGLAYKYIVGKLGALLCQFVIAPQARQDTDMFYRILNSPLYEKEFIDTASNKVFNKDEFIESVLSRETIISITNLHLFIDKIDKFRELRQNEKSCRSVFYCFLEDNTQFGPHYWHYEGSNRFIAAVRRNALEHEVSHPVPNL